MFEILDFGSRGEQGDESGADTHAQNVVDMRALASQEVERRHDEDGEEEGVVVEDGESRGLVFGNFVLLPQDALVLLFAGDLLIISEFLAHFLGNGSLPFDGDLVFELVFGVSVGEGHQPSGDDGDGAEEQSVAHHIHRVDSPEKPNGNG